MTNRLTKKQKVFVEEYLRCWNATEAAKRAGYSERSAYSIGPENLKKPVIADEIQRRIDEKIMSADEIMTRLAEQARGIPNELHDPVTGQIDVKGIIAAGLGHLIKKDYKNSSGSRVIEFYDAQNALGMLARMQGLNKDNVDVTSGGEPLGAGTEAIYDRAFSTLADAIGKEVSRKNGKSNGKVAATK